MVRPPSESSGGSNESTRGAFSTLVLVFGYAIVFFAAVSAANVAFDLKLALGARGGSATPLPTNWESVIMLAAAGVLVVGLTYFGGAVKRAFKGSKGPAGRVAVVLGTLVFLVLAGRGLQVLALTSTYGSMFVYSCTDEGDIEDVRESLEAGVTDAELDRCISRTAQWDRHDLLPDIIAAGGNFEQKSMGEEWTRCVLGPGVSLEYIRTAVELGANAKTCPKSEGLIEQLRRHVEPGQEEELEALVPLLIEAGWEAKPATQRGSSRSRT